MHRDVYIGAYVTDLGEIKVKQSKGTDPEKILSDPVSFLSMGHVVEILEQNVIVL